MKKHRSNNRPDAFEEMVKAIKSAFKEIKIVIPNINEIKENENDTQNNN